MGKVFREAIEKRKSFLINQLVNRGVYKKNDTHLFELTLSDLEEEYNKIEIKKESR
ncbi:hypothetical protein J2S09_004310 [Bacillus fengqiuensis]|nr:hypothetical protein [Bacillus fengqiuensis]